MFDCCFCGNWSSQGKQEWSVWWRGRSRPLRSRARAQHPALGPSLRLFLVDPHCLQKCPGPPNLPCFASGRIARHVGEGMRWRAVIFRCVRGVQREDSRKRITHWGFLAVSTLSSKHTLPRSHPAPNREKHPTTSSHTPSHHTHTHVLLDHGFQCSCVSSFGRLGVA